MVFYTIPLKVLMIILTHLIYVIEIVVSKKNYGRMTGVLL
jgi:hypothetical protein